MAARSFSLREKRLIQAAVVLAIIVLVSLLLRGGGGASATDPIAAPVPASRGATYAGPPPETYASRAPATPPPAAAPLPSPSVAIPSAAPAVPTAAASQLKLYGLLASGAVIGYPNGGQRLVPVGREALPGLVLVRIEQNHAVFQSAGGELRLGFDGSGQAGSGEPGPIVAR